MFFYKVEVIIKLDLSKIMRVVYALRNLVLSSGNNKSLLLFYRYKIVYMRVSILINRCKVTCNVKKPEKSEVYNFQSILTTFKGQYRPNCLQES